jgi:hypothetical protein
MVEKIDFKQTLKDLYNTAKHGFHLVEVPAMNFLMLDGRGNPNTSVDYQQAVEALYSLAYGIKFALKPQGHDHIVPPLEGLWWMNNMEDFTVANKDSWKWTMMLMQPDWITHDDFERVRQATTKKKENPQISKIRLERYIEGLTVQILYTGAYADEAPTIAEMHHYIQINGFKPNGRHHEIYLGDPRKTAPEKLKTIIRQPIIKN